MTLRRPTIRWRSPAEAGAAKLEESSATKMARIADPSSTSVHNAMLAPRAHVSRSIRRPEPCRACIYARAPDFMRHRRRGPAPRARGWRQHAELLRLPRLVGADPAARLRAPRRASPALTARLLDLAGTIRNGPTG